MLNNFNLFLKEIKRLNLIEEDSYFVPNIGIVKANEAPAGLSNSFQKIKLIDIVPTKENYLKDLQSDAINEIMLLNKDQLQNCLNRLKSFDTFSRFYKFWGGFYVKYTKNEFDNRDLFDLQMKLEGYFTVEYPKNAQIHFDFIHDLQDEIFLKDGYLDGLVHQIDEILNPIEDNKFTEQIETRNYTNILLFIKESISQSDPKSWNKYFFNENDFNALSSYVAEYLDTGELKGDYSLISITKGTKSKFATIFNQIYKRYGRENNLKSDNKYFQLLRLIIKEFSSHDDIGIYNLMTK